MTPSRNHLLLAALLASATFASTSALAQAPTTKTPVSAEAQPQGQASTKRGDKRTDRFEHMQERRAQQLATLKEKLKLTTAQESAWASFAAAQQAPAKAAFDRTEFSKLTTPQRLDRMQAQHAERSAMFAKRADATRSFYATLTPEQQKTFDAKSLPRFGPHGAGGPGAAGWGR